MLKPKVGLMTLVSSSFIRNTIVVFPELSRPLQIIKKRQLLVVHESERVRE